MSVKFCMDIGSCHLGRKDLAMKAIDESKRIGVDVLKFQLFKGEEYTQNGNIPLPYEWWPELFEYAKKIGQPITASVFDDEALHVLLETKPCFVKFSYSQRNELERMKKCIDQGVHIVSSQDFLSVRSYKVPATILFCIPEYPVLYSISFTKKMFKTFDGFSDHTLGHKQTFVAVAHGAQFIEKHMKIEDGGCPDAAFALDVEETEYMIKEIRQWEQNQHQKKENPEPPLVLTKSSSS